MPNWLVEREKCRLSGYYLPLFSGSTYSFSIQIIEYKNLVIHDSIGPSTSAYSSAFFSLTGLHGTHVLVGAILLCIMLVRTLRGHYSPEPSQHVGFKTMSVYWHFVDLVWVFVFGRFTFRETGMHGVIPKY